MNGWQIEKGRKEEGREGGKVEQMDGYMDEWMVE